MYKIMNATSINHKDLDNSILILYGEFHFNRN